MRLRLCLPCFVDGKHLYFWGKGCFAPEYVPCSVLFPVAERFLMNRVLKISFTTILSMKFSLKKDEMPGFALKCLWVAAYFAFFVDSNFH